MTIPESLGDFVFEVPHFETPAFCDHTLSRANSLGFEAATITSEKGTNVIPGIRNNDRVVFDDKDLAAQLWLKAQSYFTDPFKGFTAVCLNERFRIYRYRPGQFFDWHQDGEYVGADGLVSKFTMMIYLSDACGGGGTTFADVLSSHVFSDFSVYPEVGKCLFFHHPISHRGDDLISGEKYVLRTDVMFRSMS